MAKWGLSSPLRAEATEYREIRYYLGRDNMITAINGVMRLDINDRHDTMYVERIQGALLNSCDTVVYMCDFQQLAEKNQSRRLAKVRRIQ